MSSQSSIRRFALAAAAIVAPAVSHGGPVAASGDDDSGVVVGNAGDPATAIVLPPLAEVGHTFQSAAAIDITITVGGREIDLTIEFDLTAAVTEVADGGGYVTELTIDRIELTRAPSGIDPASLGYGELAGVQLEQTLDRSGRVLSTELLNADALSGAALETAEGFTSNLQTAQFTYPTEAVGIGATWTAELEIATEGFAVPATYQFEVTDISDGRYTLAVSYHTEFDTMIEGAAATGTVSGLGTASGSVDNPLDVSVDLGQTIDASSGGTELTVAIGVTTGSGTP